VLIHVAICTYGVSGCFCSRQIKLYSLNPAVFLEDALGLANSLSNYGATMLGSRISPCWCGATGLSLKSMGQSMVDMFAIVVFNLYCSLK